MENKVEFSEGSWVEKIVLLAIVGFIIIAIIALVAITLNRPFKGNVGIDPPRIEIDTRSEGQLEEEAG